MKKIIITAFMLAVVLQISAQETPQDLVLTAKDSAVASSWIVGLGLNAVDDSGDVLDGLVTFGDQWNVVPHPSRISIGRYTKSGLGYEAIGSYNKYYAGKVIDGVVNLEDVPYYAFDTRISYDLNKLVGETAWFDPYVGAGIGYTKANNLGRGTYNAVIGFRTWITDHWGLDFSSSGKWSMGNKATNHLQHAAGVVYQFGIEKELSKKGEEKKALLEAFEKEKQRVADSLANDASLKEAAALAKRLAEEKEKARLAALEQQKLDSIAARKQQIESEIAAIGKINFDFNSSYLNTEAKSKLDHLVAILEKYNDVILEITSHTDARGADAYNQWLSERRFDRTKNYILNSGIQEERLSGSGKGETELLNGCSNGVACKAADHRLNRRSNFAIEF